jgi:hypothetical protein
VAQIWSLNVDCGTLAAAVFIEQSPVEWAFPENQRGSKHTAIHTETHKPRTRLSTSKDTLPQRQQHFVLCFSERIEECP